MNIRLIATDLDGTLLSGGSKTVPPENARALETCARRGIKICFASGRAFQNARMLAREVRCPVAIVSLNGARADETAFGPCLFEDVISPDAALAAWHILRETDQYFICYSGSKVYMGNPQPYPGHDHTPGFRGEEGFLQEYTCDEADFLRDGYRRAGKLVFFSQKKETLLQTREKLSHLPLNLSSSWGDNVEILSDHTDKGGGLVRLAAHMGIAPEEIMAFGDFDNDETMLRAAGHPVVMRSGSDSVKKPGRALADGVGEYLMHLLEAGEI